MNVNRYTLVMIFFIKRLLSDDDEASTTCMQADQEVCGKSDATCALAASGDKMCLCDEGYATQNGGVPPFSDVCVRKFWLS